MKGNETSDTFTTTNLHNSHRHKRPTTIPLIGAIALQKIRQTQASQKHITPISALCRAESEYPHARQSLPSLRLSCAQPTLVSLRTDPPQKEKDTPSEKSVPVGKVGCAAASPTVPPSTTFAPVDLRAACCACAFAVADDSKKLRRPHRLSLRRHADPARNLRLHVLSTVHHKRRCITGKIRFSETLRTFTNTPQFGADVPDTSVPLFQPVHYHFLKKTTKFASRPRAKQHFFSPEKTRKPIKIRVQGKRSEKGRGKKGTEQGQKRTLFRTKRTVFTTKRTLFPHKWTSFQRKRTHLTSITQIGKGVPAWNFFSSSVAFSLPPH